ncbi:hypothetical protein BH11VER1_BH11VER1_13130 [soil metagenome]
MSSLPLFSAIIVSLSFIAETPLPEQEVPTQTSLPLIDQLLDSTLADGFDFPVGGADGTENYLSKDSRKNFHRWLAAITPMEPSDLSVPLCESWNGSGGSDTEMGQPVFAIGAGTVVHLLFTLRGQELIIEHHFLENGQLRVVWSVCAGLTGIKLKPGDLVKRRQEVGRVALGTGAMPTQLYLEIHRRIPEAVGEANRITLEIANFEIPSLFIRTHRHLTLPARDPGIVIAIKHDYQLHICSYGKIVKTLPMALSQLPLGNKINSGDNRTPEGEYRVTQKAEGPFDGAYAEYLGAAWIRINYPNTVDAKRAFAENRINQRECDDIVRADTENRMPSTKTSLGGGIGIHGWVTDWPEGPQNLTWGCLSLRSADLTTLYSLVKKGTKVIIHP